MDVDTAKRALVIDDEESIRNYVRYLLEAAGYEVADAGNGTRARHSPYQVRRWCQTQP